MEPIRILHVVDRLNRGGAETMIMNIYRNIDRKKIQFDFLVHSKEKSDYDDEVLELGGKIYVINSFSIKHINKYKKSIDKFFIKHDEYKIIHCHMASIASVLFSRAKKFGIPIRIIHSHNAAVDSRMREIIKDMMRPSIVRNSNVFFSCSDKSIKWLLGDKFDLSKCTIVKNGIDLDKFKFNDELRIKKRKELGLEDKFVIGHVGRFTKQKNHKFLLKVFDLIQKQRKDAVLLLVGRGELEEEIHQKVQDLNLSEKVIFMGIRDDINDLMQVMDIFLFPSLQEGLGIVLLEAQASGLKCFTSKDVVPNDIAVTNLVEFIPLDKRAEFWSEKIISANKGYKRSDTTSDIENNGFSILKSSKDMESIYLDLFNNNDLNIRREYNA